MTQIPYLDLSTGQLEQGQPAALFGNFRGAFLPEEKLEAEVLSRIPSKHLGEVVKRRSTQWWDYRFMSPARALMLCCSYLQKGYRGEVNNSAAYLRVTVDSFRTKVVKREGRFGYAHGNKIHTGIDPLEASNSEWSVAWNLMRAADDFGMPYDLYINHALRFTLEYWQRKFAPQPNNLYSVRVAGQVMDLWDDMRDNCIQVARHPLYRAENYCGLPAQDAYIDALMQHVQKRQSIGLLCEVVYDNPQVPEHKAREYFDDYDLYLAKQRAL